MESLSRLSSFLESGEYAFSAFGAKTYWIFSEGPYSRGFIRCQKPFDDEIAKQHVRPTDTQVAG